MPKNDGRFTSERQPKSRGRPLLYKLLDTIRDESLLKVGAGASRAECERAYLKHLAVRAFDSEDQSSGTLLKSLLDKTYSSVKATMAPVEFEYDHTVNPTAQVNQIIHAASVGDIPPDVAAIFLQAVKNAVDIEESTELKMRIEALEKSING